MFQFEKTFGKQCDKQSTFQFANPRKLGEIRVSVIKNLEGL